MVCRFISFQLRRIRRSGIFMLSYKEQLSNSSCNTYSSRIKTAYRSAWLLIDLGDGSSFWLLVGCTNTAALNLSHVTRPEQMHLVGLFYHGGNGCDQWQGRAKSNKDSYISLYIGCGFHPAFMMVHCSSLPITACGDLSSPC